MNASLNGPKSVAVDPSGNLYIADTDNNRIRRVSAADGTITTIAGTGDSGYAGDGDPAVNALIGFPKAIAVDASGNVFFYDSVERPDPESRTNGQISTVAGNGKPVTRETAQRQPFPPT